MKRFTKRAAALGLAAVLALSPVARASYALGHNLHTSTVDLAGGASLTQWRFWSDTYADLRTERYLTYTPGGDVSPEIAYGDKVLTGKVNVDEEPELARRFGVMSIPTVVFLKNGVEVERKVGVMPQQAYADVLDARL